MISVAVASVVESIECSKKVNWCEECNRIPSISKSIELFDWREEEVIDIYVWFNFENWEKQSLFISGRERSLSEKNGKEIYNCSTVESLCFLAFLFNDLSGCNTIQNISFLP